MNDKFKAIFPNNSDFVNQVMQSAMDQLFDKFNQTNIIEVKYYDIDYSTYYQLQYDTIKGFHAIIENLKLDFVPFFPIIVPENMKPIFKEAISLTDSFDELIQEIAFYELYLRMKKKGKNFMSLPTIENLCANYLQISVEELNENIISEQLNQKEVELLSLERQLQKNNISIPIDPRFNQKPVYPNPQKS